MTAKNNRVVSNHTTAEAKSISRNNAVVQMFFNPCANRILYDSKPKSLRKMFHKVNGHNSTPCTRQWIDNLTFSLTLVILIAILTSVSECRPKIGLRRTFTIKFTKFSINILFSHSSHITMTPYTRYVKDLDLYIRYFYFIQHF